MSDHEAQAQPASPSMQMTQMLWPGPMAVQAIHLAAKLSLADLVAGAKTIDELAEATHTHAPSLARLLRALTSLGIFAEDEMGRYRQTALSETLRSDYPDSIRPSAMMLGAHFFWRPIGSLEETVRTGQPSFERLYGAPFFDYLAGHPDDAAIFNAAMSSSPGYLAAIVSAYAFSKFEQIVDVGGGRGNLLAAILSANSGLRGVLYDLPAVVAGASALRQEPISRRSEIVGGDFFQDVPAGADAYILKGIIHDWNDEAALKILKNCRRAIRRDGTLLLAENVLTPSTEPAMALMDMLMMVLTTGRERTESEFRALVQEAGFSMVQVIRGSGVSIIESRPV